MSKRAWYPTAPSWLRPRHIGLPQRNSAAALQGFRASWVWERGDGQRLPFCGGADPDRSAAESVDEMAQLKQIAEAAQSTRADVGFAARAHRATMTFDPVSPLGRDQRATAVGEAGQHEQNTASADTADDGERRAPQRIAP